MSVHRFFSSYIYLKVNLLSYTVKSSKSSLCVKTENKLFQFSIPKYDSLSLKPKIDSKEMFISLLVTTVGCTDGKHKKGPLDKAT